MVICLGQGVDLHMAQLMPLPFTVSWPSKSRLVLPFWYRLTQVVPNKGPLTECCCFMQKITLVCQMYSWCKWLHAPDPVTRDSAPGPHWAWSQTPNTSCTFSSLSVTMQETGNNCDILNAWKFGSSMPQPLSITSITALP